MSQRVDKKNLNHAIENLKTNANILKRETSYNINETVNKGQVVLKCITAGTTDRYPLDFTGISVGDTLTDGTAEWQVMSTTGYGFGSGGTSISEWATSTSYETGQIVIYGDSLYRCITDHTSNTFNGDIANWELMYSDIAEWRDSVYYPEGVTVIHDHKLYQCLTAHLSLITFDGAKWQIIGDYVAVPVKVGSVGYVSWQYTLMQNHLALDGSVVSNFQATYPELYDFFNTNSLITTVQADYDANHALLLYDSVNDEATMPDFLDKTVWGGTIVEEKEAGLPNIEGQAMFGAGSSGLLRSVGMPGAFDKDGAVTRIVNSEGASGYTAYQFLKFDASLSNSIYGNSTTVQPPAIILIPQIRYTQDYIESAGGGADLPEWQANTSYTAGKYLVHEGTVYRVDNDFTSGTTFSDSDLTAYIAPIMQGATSSTDGKAGMVIKPTTTDVDKFLKGDGTWGSAGGGISIWQANTEYEVNDVVIDDNLIWQCLVAHTSTTTFDESKWEEISGGGIFAWKSNKNYKVGIMVVYKYCIYMCKVAHISTSEFDYSKWIIIGGNGNSDFGDYVGHITWQMSLQSNYLKLDGTPLANASSDYNELLKYAQDNNLITADTTDKSLFKYDSTNDVLTLPDYIGLVLQGGNIIEEKEAGLPNIEAKNDNLNNYYWCQISGNITAPISFGAIQFNIVDNNYMIQTPVQSGNTLASELSFDASRSSSIYGNSTTVQPPAITLIPQIRYKYSGITYSTEEQRIGTWIDGKPLYQKTYSGTTPSTANTNTNIFIDSILQNIDMCHITDGYIKLDFGSYGIDFYNINEDKDSSYSSRIFISGSESAIRGSVGSSFISCPIVVTIQYTKTTD